MGRQAWEESEARFVKYLDGLTSVIGHADRAAPLKGYCTGLLAAEGRRSVEPMAAVTAPAGVSAQHQKLLHFVANAAWSDELVLAKVQEMVLPQIERHGPIEAWIIDDTSFPKQGRHSVGVHHQYCGQLGKQANCQVAAGVARGVVLMDASYGSNSALRGGVSALALSYVAGIVPTIKVQAVTESGKPGPRVSAKELALGLPKGAWRTVTWREGTNERLASRFARVRVRTSPIRRAKERAEETLLVEWPEGEEEPTKYWLATLPKSTSFRRLVDIAKMRWRIERDYQDLKQEIGLGHYEGRGWPGFHHHGTLCIAAYGFLVSERETIPPSGTRSSRSLTKTALPDGYRPRGAPDPAPTSRAQLDCHPASQTGRRHRSNAAQMPMLRT
jgi:SRSO17 transposase